MSKQFRYVDYFHFPREENQIADALATLAALFDLFENPHMRTLDLSIRESPVHCFNVEEEVKNDKEPWYHNILQYVRDQTYEEGISEKDKKTI